MLLGINEEAERKSDCKGEGEKDWTLKGSCKKNERKKVKKKDMGILKKATEDKNSSSEWHRRRESTDKR